MLSNPWCLQLHNLHNLNQWGEGTHFGRLSRIMLDYSACSTKLHNIAEHTHAHTDELLSQRDQHLPSASEPVMLPACWAVSLFQMPSAHAHANRRQSNKFAVCAVHLLIMYQALLLRAFLQARTSSHTTIKTIIYYIIMICLMMHHSEHGTSCPQAAALRRASHLSSEHLRTASLWVSSGKFRAGEGLGFRV